MKVYVSNILISCHFLEIKKTNKLAGEVWLTLCILTLKQLRTFYKHGLILIQAWISSLISSRVLDEITNPFLNFNGFTIEV